MDDIYLLHHRQFLLIFSTDNFHEILADLSGISQISNDFGENDVKILIFQRNLRKFIEILQNYDAKSLKICLKKCML